MGTAAMTVYVVHDVRDDISPALKFGKLQYVNRFYIHGDELERSGDDNLIPKGYLANMNRAAATFHPETDFLLIAGDHLQLLALTAILISKFHSFMVLRYDRQMNDYIPVRLYSGLVPPGGRVLYSGTNIGDDHGESRNQEDAVDPGKGDDTAAFWPDARNLETLSADDAKIKRHSGPGIAPKRTAEVAGQRAAGRSQDRPARAGNRSTGT